MKRTQLAFLSRRNEAAIRGPRHSISRCAFSYAVSADLALTAHAPEEFSRQHVRGPGQNVRVNRRFQNRSTLRDRCFKTFTLILLRIVQHRIAASPTADLVCIVNRCKYYFHVTERSTFRRQPAFYVALAAPDLAVYQGLSLAAGCAVLRCSALYSFEPADTVTDVLGGG